jgi:spore coat polysaccharide biosynthesis protein SpsF
MLKLRKAQIEDCRIVYDIRNDPKIRVNSFSDGDILLEDHVKWFESSLRNDRRKIFIIEDEQVVLGVVRFDVSEDLQQAIVSINVSASSWGKGVGSFALQEGEKAIKLEYPELKGIVARVLAHNEASMKLFSKWKRLCRNCTPTAAQRTRSRTWRSLSEP